MEELDLLSPNEKITFKKHYDRIQYALKKLAGKSARAPLSPIQLTDPMADMKK